MGCASRLLRLPDDVAASARPVILAYVGVHHERAAITAAATLMLAAVEAGCTRTAIADALGMHHQTVARRVETARERFGGSQPGLFVEPPPTPRPRPRPQDVLRQPIDEREWLTLH